LDVVVRLLDGKLGHVPDHLHASHRVKAIHDDRSAISIARQQLERRGIKA
jgi:hypothetical protein